MQTQVSLVHVHHRESYEQLIMPSVTTRSFNFQLREPRVRSLQPMTVTWSDPGLHKGPLNRSLTKMDDVLLVHVLDAFADLAHVVNDLGFRHDVTLGGDALEQLASRQAAGDNRDG